MIPSKKILPSLNPVEKAMTSNLIKDTITELWSILPPVYFGMLNGQPYLDKVFWTEGLNPKISGPSANQGDMSLAIIEKAPLSSTLNIMSRSRFIACVCVCPSRSIPIYDP